MANVEFRIYYIKGNQRESMRFSKKTNIILTNFKHFEGFWKSNVMSKIMRQKKISPITGGREGGQPIMENSMKRRFCFFIETFPKFKLLLSCC
jgi:hypothetical protein